MDDLTKALRDAATSLETIASLSGRKSYGNPPVVPTHMETFMDVRLYAAARAKVAREAIATLEKELALHAAGPASQIQRWGYTEAEPTILQPTPDGAWVYWQDVVGLFASPAIEANDAKDAAQWEPLSREVLGAAAVALEEKAWEDGLCVDPDADEAANTIRAALGVDVPGEGKS